MHGQKEYILKKYKQAARREAKKSVEELTPEICRQKIVRPKPRFVPAFLWKLLLKIVLVKNADLQV